MVCSALLSVVSQLLSVCVPSDFTDGSDPEWFACKARLCTTSINQKRSLLSHKVYYILSYTIRHTFLIAVISLLPINNMINVAYFTGKSKWRDSNSQPYAPKAYALPIALHLDMERLAGFEPVTTAWKAVMLPLHQRRTSGLNLNWRPHPNSYLSHQSYRIYKSEHITWNRTKLPSHQSSANDRNRTELWCCEIESNYLDRAKATSRKSIASQHNKRRFRLHSFDVPPMCLTWLP